MGCQNGYSAREAAIHYLCSVNQSKEQYISSVFDACNLSNVKLYLKSDFIRMI